MTTAGTSTDAVTGLEPKAIWKLFADLSAVPRPSMHEEQVAAHLVKVAEEKGFACRQDTERNLVMEVPATQGYEHIPTLVLQAHMDMVPEANTGTEHDFMSDPISLVLDTEPGTDDLIVRADGTTLGADNGIGLVMAIAVAEDPQAVHGPLEILITTNEEMGMSGAKTLAADFFKGRRMLNLDSEEDDAVYIGCAGGADVTLKWQLPLSEVGAGEEVCRITVGGLKGGHSGDNIHLNRANANKLLTAVLARTDTDQIRLVEFQGGSKRNAIPREAGAVVAGPVGTADLIKQSAAKMQALVQELNGEVDCAITVAATEAKKALSSGRTQTLIKCFMGLPCGVLAVVPDIPGLTQTSNNVATIVSKVSGDGNDLNIRIGCLTRSSAADDLHLVTDQICAVAELTGAEVKVSNEYPGWQPNLDSPLLATSKRVYTELFGNEPKVAAIHAGLECGIIGERVGGLDVISIGPRIEGAHSPDERVWVTSVQKSYRFLKSLLAALAQEG